jgi:hypothetical protein
MMIKDQKPLWKTEKKKVTSDSGEYEIHKPQRSQRFKTQVHKEVFIRF